jgi:DNA-binding MarR family transcriptional regulator
MVVLDSIVSKRKGIFMDNYREIFLVQQISGTLFSLVNKVQIQGDKCCGNLTTRQYMAMIAIIHLQEDETTLNNIARKLGTTKQSVKQLITILEGKGYVLTVPSENDKRAVNVKITEPGKKAMLECSEKSLYFMADLFNEFSTEEMEILWMLLKKLYRFDGEEQDGFEESVDFKASEDQEEIQNRALKEFERRRNKRK